MLENDVDHFSCGRGCRKVEMENEREKKKKKKVVYAAFLILLPLIQLSAAENK